MSWVFVATTAFLGECVPLQAAGAFALGNMLRNPGAAIAAVLYPPLVKRMGIAWFFTGFALLDLVVVGSSVLGESDEHMNCKSIGLTLVTVLRFYGQHWRQKSQSPQK